MTYSEKLKDPRWQKRRLEILERDKFTCQECSATVKELHVHHRAYLRKTDPWDYPDSSLTTLCVDCHQSLTHMVDRISESVGRLNESSVSSLMYLLDELLHQLTPEEISEWLGRQSLKGAICPAGFNVSYLELESRIEGEMWKREREMGEMELRFRIENGLVRPDDEILKFLKPYLPEKRVN